MIKTETGTVTSTKMQKTVVVSVLRKFRHAVYQKVITRHRKFKAHNELPDIKEGDTVRIRESRPYSKETHFEVVEKIADKK